jgi:hypothetical protein
MAQEMEEHATFYKEYLGRYDMEGEGEVKFDVEQSEWDRVMREARSDGLAGMLQGIHIFALCHVIRRPIILFCSDKCRQDRGEGAAGVAGTYLPIRLRPEECASKEPVAVAWANEVFHHFVPLVGVAEHLAPVWPLMHPAWSSFGGKTMELYIQQTSGRKLLEGDSLVLQGMKDSLLGFTEREGKMKHPTTGVYYDQLVLVKDVFFCGFNKGETPDAVTSRFLNDTPQIAQLPATELADVLDQLKRMIRKTLSKNKDGTVSKTPGICDCGFKHWMNDVEVDFVAAVSSDTFLGWNFGDDIFAVTERFLQEHGYVARAGARHSLLVLILSKERQALNNEAMKRFHREENVASMAAVCSQCKEKVMFGKYDIQVVCGTCQTKSQTPNLTKAAIAACQACKLQFPLIAEQRFRQCPHCSATMLKVQCAKCDATCVALGKSGAPEFECPRCATRQPTGWPRIFREENAAKRLLPATKIITYTDVGTTTRVLEAISKSNQAVEASLALSSEELECLRQLEPLHKNALALESANLERMLDLVLNKLLVWPVNHRFAGLDVLRIVLLNDGCRLKVAHSEAIMKRVIAAGWEDGSDWRCRFNGLKCICNLLPAMTGGKILKDTFSRVLGFINDSFCGADTKAHELVASAQTILNFSTLFWKFL